jgi:hypothetical protein
LETPKTTNKSSQPFDRERKKKKKKKSQLFSTLTLRCTLPLQSAAPNPSRKTPQNIQLQPFLKRKKKRTKPKKKKKKKKITSAKMLCINSGLFHTNNTLQNTKKRGRKQRDNFFSSSLKKSAK